jgi:hypothetical protein
MTRGLMSKTDRGSPWVEWAGHRGAIGRPERPKIILLNVREDTVQLVQAVIGHHQLSFATRGVADRDFGA